MFLEIPQNLKENTCARVFFLIKLQSLLKKRLWHRCFPVNLWNFYEYLFYRTLWAIASTIWQNFNMGKVLVQFCILQVHYLCLVLHTFFIRNTFFNSVSVLLSFFINWASNFAKPLLNTYKLIILRHLLYSLFWRPCLDLRLFMSYLCDLFFIFIFFFMINRVISWTKAPAFLLIF